MKNILLTLVLLVVVLLNCFFQLGYKSNYSVSELLTQAQWTKTRNFEDLDLDGNFTEYGRDCEIDDSWTFKSDSVLIQEAGMQLCDPSDTLYGNNIKSRWYLENNGQFLVLDFDLDESKFLINSCDEHELVLSLWNEDTPDIFKYQIILSR